MYGGILFGKFLAPAADFHRDPFGRLPPIGMIKGLPGRKAPAAVLFFVPADRRFRFPEELLLRFGKKHAPVLRPLRIGLEGKIPQLRHKGHDALFKVFPGGIAAGGDVLGPFGEDALALVARLFPHRKAQPPHGPGVRRVQVGAEDRGRNVQAPVGMEIHVKDDVGVGADEIINRPHFPIVQGLRPAGGARWVRIILVPLKGELAVGVQVLLGAGVAQGREILRPAAENALRDQGVKGPLHIVRLALHHDPGVLFPGLPLPRGVQDAHLADFPVPVQVAGLDAVFLRVILFRGAPERPGRGQVDFRRVRVDPGNGVDGITIQKGSDPLVLPVSGQPLFQRVQDRHGGGHFPGMDVAVHEKRGLFLRRPGLPVADRQAPDVPALPGFADAGQRTEPGIGLDKALEGGGDFVVSVIMIHLHGAVSLP